MNSFTRTKLNAWSNILPSGSTLLKKVMFTIGTVAGLYAMMTGGEMPGGRMRRMVPLIALTWAIAAPMSMPWWKKTLTRPTPGMQFDSMRSMPATVVEYARSEMITTRRSISSAERPEYCQPTNTTGISILGKKSTIIRVAASTPSSSKSSDSTATEYGRRNDSRTSSIMVKQSPLAHPLRCLRCPGTFLLWFCGVALDDKGCVPPASRAQIRA